MQTEDIKKVGIDTQERLYIMPCELKFEFIYRSASGINWSDSEKKLYAPKPTKEISYVTWYKQILLATKYEYGVELNLTSRTIWNSIPADLKNSDHPIATDTG